MSDEHEERVVRRERFSGGPAREFLSSMDADRRLFEADLAVDRAHVVMLATQDIIDDAAATAILDALESVENAGFDELPDGEDIHEAIESAVVDTAGDAGRRLHTARSRNDEVATCLRSVVREELLETAESTLALRETLTELASEHLETTMGGYTHLQPAQPTTLAHTLCSYEQAIRRDTERLLDAYDRVNRSPLGAAAFAGTPFDVDRTQTAELLGFDGVLENAMDAVSARDFMLESVSALAALATTCSGIAEDLVIYSNKELLTLEDDYASTSSIMPQKKNPDTLELVRATAGDAAAGLNGLLGTLSGLPRAYNRDLQAATPHAWHAFDAVPEAVDVVTGAIATAEFHDELLATEAAQGFSTATGVADLLATNGLAFRTAHEIVADAAQLLDSETMDDPDAQWDALETACQDLLDRSLTALAPESKLQTALDPAGSVAMRDSRGGPAPDAMKTALESTRQRLDVARTGIDTRREALETAREHRESEVASYL